MTAMPELLPCPFCGGVAEYIRDRDDGGNFVAVQCTGCGCGSGKHYPLADYAAPNAAREWNRRQPSADALAEE